MTWRARANDRASSIDAGDRNTVITRAGLAITRTLAPRFQRFGVEPNKLVALVELRFTLDRRNAKQKMQGGFVLAFGPMLVIALLVSATLALIVCVGTSAAFGVAVFAGGLEILLPMLLIGAWIDVLLDGSAESVLGSRPIDDRTVLAARLVFLAMYATSTIVTLAALPIICGSIEHGAWPFLPAALIGVVCASALSILALLLTFLVLAHAVPADRFRVWVLRLQFSIAIALPVLFQVVPRFAGRVRDLFPEWAALFFPPAWSGAVATVLAGHARALDVAFCVLAFSVPLTMFALAMRLARGRLVAATMAPQAEARTPARGATHALARLMQRLCRTESERAAFEFARVLTIRERTYLVRTLPSLLATIAPFAMLLLSAHGATRVVDPAVGVALMPLLLAIGHPMFAMFARRSETPQAAWIFTTVPNAEPRTLRFGVRAAVLARWCFLPGAISIVAATALGGLERGLFAAFVSLVGFHAGALAHVVLLEETPFSGPYVAAAKDRGAATGFLMLYTLGLMIVGGALYATAAQTVAHAIGTIVLAAMAPWSWSRLRS